MLLTCAIVCVLWVLFIWIFEQFNLSFFIISKLKLQILFLYPVSHIWGSSHTKILALLGGFLQFDSSLEFEVLYLTLYLVQV